MRRHKVIRFFLIKIVLIIQIVLLVITVKEKYETDSFATIVSLIIISLIMFYGYKYLDLHHEEYAYEKVSVALWVPLGTLICYSLNAYCGLGSILAAGITGTVASFLPLINKQSDYLKKLPAAIYCGAFVGMSSTEISPSITFAIAAGSITGILYMLSKNLFLGLGGKLGTIAFIGVAVVYLINSFY